MKRCRAGIANHGCACGKAFHTPTQAKECGLENHDQCRRRAGHEKFTGNEDAEWHLLDCGGAFSDDGVYTADWTPIFHRVDEDGDIVR
jgi:hypothetical protein